VEESEDDDVNSGKLITPDVPTDPEFANLARIDSLRRGSLRLN
jgi:hypothetical protein